MAITDLWQAGMSASTFICMRKEKVYTIEDYYDGPRGGIANFNGKPHVYECLFDDLDDEYSNGFKLMEISEETLQIALKSWNLWIKWDDKQNKTKEEMDSHPVLPEDRELYDKLSAEIKKRLKIDDDKSLVADGTFESVKKGWNGYVVEWKVRNDPTNL